MAPPARTVHTPLIICGTLAYIKSEEEGLQWETRIHQKRSWGVTVGHQDAPKAKGEVFNNTAYMFPLLPNVSIRFLSNIDFLPKSKTGSLVGLVFILN